MKGVAGGLSVALALVVAACSSDVDPPGTPGGTGGGGTGGTGGSDGGAGGAAGSCVDAPPGDDLSFVAGGTYAAVPPSTEVNALALGDLDGDGRVDLVFGGNPSPTAQVWLNGGDGTFTSRGAVPLDDWPKALYLGRLDADAGLDLVSISECAASDCAYLEVLSGLGNGTFLTAQRAIVPESHMDVLLSRAAIGDVDGDGRDEIYATGESELYAWLVRRQMSGMLEASEVRAFDAVVLADFDGDGALDVAGTTADADLYGLHVHLNDGDGTFIVRAQVASLAHRTRHLAAGDLNGDGQQDLVTIDEMQTLQVWMGSEDGSTLTPSQYALGAGPNRWPVLADIDGDCDQDLLLTSGSRVQILLNRAGLLVEGPQIDVGGEPSALAVVDVDGDGRLDLVVARRDLADVRVFFNRHSAAP
ncbi:FG-GAP repeat domain-containing protein [Chondromyces crocatus]|uniref:Uncharacterized protein n=1 Tax=Chondromyces crocatus TaxID=52 RepID=A0A0K1ELP7_CHOCO|nr:VCBS repeat-containing protein [Chondromyces crocatus]AKT41741.1 uncharacterized protein CMC5_059520 [Chondromyces crocatus]